MKRISVITVNYNDKKGLEKTLQSVTSQTLNDFDFVVIDGGSTDGSKELLESYSNKLTHWVSESDNGIYNAMNKGIKAATGEFVIFMNAGDVFSDEKVIENVYDKLVPSYDIFYGDNYKVKGSTRRKKTYPEHLSFSFFYTSSINHQSTFIRRQLFFDHFFYNENYKIASDWEFFVYTICKMNVPYKYLNQTISLYDFEGISSSEKGRSKMDEEKKLSIQKYFPLFVEDYTQIADLNSKRVQQVFYLKRFPVAWKVLKGIISFLLFFVPKMKK